MDAVLSVVLQWGYQSLELCLAKHLLMVQSYQEEVLCDSKGSWSTAGKARVYGRWHDGDLLEQVSTVQGVERDGRR